MDASPPCLKCTAPNDAHYLTCPTLRLDPGWYSRVVIPDAWIDFLEEQDLRT